jgi:hypothetical protein
VYDLLRDGQIIGFSVGGRRYIDSASVRAFIARRVADQNIIRYIKPPAQPAPEPPRMDRRRRKRRTEPIENAA